MKNQKLPISGSTHRVTYSADETPDEVIFDKLRRGQIPIISTDQLNMMDNRVCCRYARRDLPNWSDCSFLADGHKCGATDNRLCVFDEPQDAEIWQRIEEQKQFAAKRLAKNDR